MKDFVMEPSAGRDDAEADVAGADAGLQHSFIIPARVPGQTKPKDQ